jgi:hypothetical protein
MAYTTSFTMKTVLGNERVHGYKITADGATAEIDTGLDVINHFSAHQNVTSTNVSILPNVLTAATASNGTLAITGATSGDVFFVTVYGR